MSENNKNLLSEENTKFSPMMEHYINLKKEYADCIILYRLGDFYEMFFDDAITASKILDITLTGRDCGGKDRAPMCGVPYHAVDAYISTLVGQGYKVAICEQLTNPGDQKGMVKRDIVRVITPGTMTDENNLDSSTNNYLASVYSDDMQEFAISYVDITTGDLYVEEKIMGLDKLDDFLKVNYPKEIVCTENIKSNISKLSFFKLNNSRFEISTKYIFEKDYAKNIILEFYKIKSIGAINLENENLSVPSIGALLNYIKSTQKQILENIQLPTVIRSSENMFLDFSTIRNLEIVETLFEKNKKGSILGVIDKTSTKMGARLLRKWILEPLINADKINLRLNAIEELINQPDYITKVSPCLKNMRDIERLAQKIAANQINPKEMLSIMEFLAYLPYIKTSLKGVKSQFLKHIYDNVIPLDKLTEEMTSALKTDVGISFKDGNIINDGYNQKLDKLRVAMTSGKGLMAEYEMQQKEKTNIRTLKVAYNRIFGYYIEVSQSFKDKVPYEYERKQTLANAERYTTKELKELESYLMSASVEALKLEEELFLELRNTLKEQLKVLQMNARLIAVLDIFISNAIVAKNNRYCKPTINAKTKSILIKECRHPVVESYMKANSFVSNDVLLDKESTILMITGPNMAGKSTYMREVAIAVLFAHCGFFVPATRAEICLVDRIFTRIGASDNLALGQSTFMLEMIEVANILHNATQNSLIILDEVGRGTSTLDGLSIAWAITEEISTKIKAKTLFATHYHELCQLEELLPNVKNYHILIQEKDDAITFLYKIARGMTNRSFGIEVGEISGVPKNVTMRAKKILQSLENSHVLSEKIENQVNVDINEVVASKQVGFFEIDPNLKQLKNILGDVDLNNYTPLQALTLLSEIKKLVEKIDG